MPRWVNRKDAWLLTFEVEIQGESMMVILRKRLFASSQGIKRAV